MATGSKRGQPVPEPDDALPDELAEEQVIELPPREALSIVDPGVFGLRNPIAPPRPADPAAPGADPEPASYTGESQN
jgi:hypothetical protein